MNWAAVCANAPVVAVVYKSVILVCLIFPSLPPTPCILPAFVLGVTFLMLTEAALVIYTTAWATCASAASVTVDVSVIPLK